MQSLTLLEFKNNEYIDTGKKYKALTPDDAARKAAVLVPLNKSEPTRIYIKDVVDENLIHIFEIKMKSKFEK